MFCEQNEDSSEGKFWRGRRRGGAKAKGYATLGLPAGAKPDAPPWLEAEIAFPGDAERAVRAKADDEQLLPWPAEQQQRGAAGPPLLQPAGASLLLAL